MTRTVVVTGTASGIGKATAELLRRRENRVIGVDLHDSDVIADLGTTDGRDSAVTSILEHTEGTVDAVVACAGLAGMNPKLIAVNYFGVVGLLENLRPALAAARQPRAAVVSSTVAIHPGDSALVDACLAGDEADALARAEQAVEEGRGRQLYPSSKTALTRWVRRTSIAPGWADTGIPLNAVGPGVVLTPMSAGIVTDDDMKKAQDAAVPMPLNGYQGPEVIAAALAFLVSEENTHITGQMLFADGGAEVTHRGADTF